jgi:polysaccharide biosynthesis protein PslG
MKKYLVLLTLLFTATVLWAQPKGTVYDQLRKPEGAQFYHVPIALCEDYPEESTTPEIIRNDMEMLKRSGINVLRISFGWDGIETSKGKYNWLFWDDYVKTAVDEYGITLIPYICYTPSWNSTGDTTNFWNHTPKDYDAFGDFIFALVSRYKDRIKSWELWNEPDIPEYWSGNAADLAKLTKIGAQAIRKADPKAIVVLAGLAGHTEFTRTLFRDLDISPYVDVVNCHSYYETWNGDPLETVVPYVNTLSDIIRQYGNKQSLWMAEVGYSTVRRPDGYVSNSYWATYDYEHTPDIKR